MNRKIILTLLFLLSVTQAGAFLDGTPEHIQQDLQNIITYAAQGSTSAYLKLMDELELYEQLDLTDHTEPEVIAYLQRLAKSGKFPSYIFDRGNYSYNTGSNYLYTTGKNTPVYSLPVRQNSGIIARLGTEYMTYLGRWRDRGGNSWVFVQYRDSGKTGWLTANSVRLVPNSTFKNIISEIQRGIQEHNLTVLTNAAKKE